MGHWTVVRPHCNVCLRARRAVPSVVVDIKVGDKDRRTDERIDR